MHPCYFFYKNTCKICCAAWPESLWVSDCITQGIRASLVWYQQITCHLSGRAAKENVVVLWTVWTGWWPCCVLKLSQITHPADSCSVKLSRGCKDVNPACLSECAATLSNNLLLLRSRISTQHHRKNSCKSFFQKAAIVNSVCIRTQVCVCMYVYLIVEATEHIVNEA